MDDEKWLDALSPDIRTQATEMMERLKQLNCSDPAAWVRSEIEEDIPQTARFLALSAFRKGAMDAFLYSDRRGASLKPTLNPAQILSESDAALKRLVALGADINDVLRISRAATFIAVFELANVIDDGGGYDLPSDECGWALVETRDGAITGRIVDGLHENLIDVFTGDVDLQNQ